jgi:Ser/Thr protein kinase RdoA (MazF antagonist)
MTISLQSIPGFTAAEALAVAEVEFGVAGRISALPSERDQNFLITDAGGKKFVLKIANSNDTPELLDFQNQAMRLVENKVADCRGRAAISRLSRMPERVPITGCGC